VRKRSSPENVDKKENRSGACRFGFCFVSVFDVFDFCLIGWSLSAIVTVLRKILGELLLNPAWVVGIMFKFDGRCGSLPNTQVPAASASGRISADRQQARLSKWKFDGLARVSHCIVVNGAQLIGCRETLLLRQPNVLRLVSNVV
jgi:hypothetical protein